MKIERLFIYCLLAGALLLASCGNDELTDNPIAEPLPEGMYPVTFTATQGEVAATPQTRVSENTDGTSSRWNAGDRIKVKVSDNNGNNMETTCTLAADGNITAYDPQLYWQTTGNHTINAWYSNITGQNTTSSTVSLADQSSGLAYVLKADQLTDQNYKSGNIALAFKHQLAKVRVKLVKGTTAADLTNATVKIKNQYTSCSISNGAVTATGTSNGTITMHTPTTTDGYYEANIVPGTTLKDDAFEISSADGKNTATANLASEITLTAATVNTITLTIDKAGPKVITPGTDNTYTIGAGADVMIKDYKGSAPIIVNGDATITIENVQLTTSGTAMTINNGADVTLNVVGTNNSLVSSSGSGITLDNNASIYIEGENLSLSKLEVKASETTKDGCNVGIGAKSGNVSINEIEIRNITLNVIGGKQHSGYGSGSAAIGLNSLHSGSGGHVQTCNLISITDSNITAKSDGGACIGLGVIMAGSGGGGKAEIGTITVASSTIQGTSTGNGYGDPGGACVGSGAIANNLATGKIGKIDITSTTFSNCNVGGYTVGRGGVSTGGLENNFTMNEGIIVDGNNKGTAGWNP